MSVKQATLRDMQNVSAILYKAARELIGVNAKAMARNLQRDGYHFAMAERRMRGVE